MAVLGTAVGIAAVTAVFSLADAALLRPLPYYRSGRLVMVWDQLLKLGFTRFPVSVANYQDYRAHNVVFADLAAFEPRQATVAFAGRAERVPVTLASANFLPLLGVAVDRGRWFAPAENHRGSTLVAVVSHTFWTTRLGADPRAIGGVIRVDGEPRTVVGVLPESFAFRLSGEPPAVWLPANLDVGPRDAGNLRVVARLRDGVGVARAQSAMTAFAVEWKRRFRVGMGPHGEDGGYSIAVIPLREELFGSLRSTIYALLAASLLLLALSFANTSILWLARSAARRRDAAVRLALGASWGGLARQLALESLLPSAAGGALALVFVLAAFAGINAARLSELSALDGLAIDFRVFLLAVLLSTVAGVCFGVVPLRSLGQSPLPNARDISDRREGRTLRFLIAIQVGLACAFLPAALLLARSLIALERIDPGFRAAGLLTAYVTLPAGRYPTPELAAGYYRRLEEGFPSAALTSALPLTLGTGGDPFSIEGRVYGSSGNLPQFAHAMSVGRRYLSTMRIPLRAGRAFEDRDFAPSAEPVALVNQTLARAFWPGESPLGKHILMGAPRPGARWMTIVGITGDIRTAELGRPPIPQIYRPFPQAATRTMAVVSPLPLDLGAVAALDPEAPPYDIRPMTDRVAGSIVRPRVRAAVFTVYGTVALLLAAFGVYSVALYASVRRRREFGLRAALGASPARLRKTLLLAGLGPSACGAAPGLAAGWWLVAGVHAFLFGASAADWRAYVCAGLLSVGAAVGAAWCGGRRLLNDSPADVLRSE